ncbi:MAG: CRISPR-associated endonuclease Cas6 [Bacteroidales bacterium]
MLTKKLPYLAIVLEEPLAVYETPLLRRAVLKLTRYQELLYHNHVSNSFRYGYPLIQYKSIGGHAAILYLYDGVDGIPALYNRQDRKVRVNGRTFSFVVNRVRSFNYNLVCGNVFFRYQLRNWLPLQDDNWEEYRSLTDEFEQRDLLRRILTGNIKSFARGVDWNIDRVEIGDFTVVREKWVSFKRIKFKAFDVQFSADLFLPPWIGLGKGAAHNYGVVSALLSNNETGKL